MVGLYLGLRLADSIEKRGCRYGCLEPLRKGWVDERKNEYGIILKESIRFRAEKKETAYTKDKLL